SMPVSPAGRVAQGVWFAYIIKYSSFFRRLGPCLARKFLHSAHKSERLAMAFDIDMIKRVYEQLPERIAAARKVVGRPMTFTEKVLYAHLADALPAKPYARGKDYVNFNPDRVAMQDATAQMALLQF